MTQFPHLEFGIIDSFLEPPSQNTNFHNFQDLRFPEITPHFQDFNPHTHFLLSAQSQSQSQSQTQTQTPPLEPNRSCDSKKSERKKNTNKLKVAKKEKKVATPPQPLTGYVHVRARRGEATDPHSLAERVRRKQISMRMKFLQSLVPGCDKITGMIHILDQIIGHVLNLQNQVEFLAANLASAKNDSNGSMINNIVVPTQDKNLKK